MEFFEEINKLCKPRYVQQLLSELPEARAADSLIQQLYRLTYEGKHTEQEIVRRLYGRTYTPKHPPFRSLKSRLRHILADAYLVQELKRPGYKTYMEAYTAGYAQLAVVRLLLKDRAYTAVRDIATNVFEHVRHFEIVPLNAGLTEVLTACYLSVLYNEELYHKYSELNRYYNQAAYDLGLVTYHYRNVRSGIYAQRLSNFELGNAGAQHAELLSEIADRYPAISLIQGMVYSTLTTVKIQQAKFKEAIDVARKGIERLSACAGRSNRSLEILGLSMVDCTIKLADFELGVAQVEIVRPYIKQGTVNEVKLADLSVLLGLRTRQYAYAYRAFATTSRRTINRVLPPRHIEYWNIMEAYLNMLIVAGELRPQDDWPKIRNFRINKFLNEVPVFSRVKNGANIQILILQSVFLIVRGEFAKASDRTAALSAYSYRYLGQTADLRTKYFFQLLRKASTANYNRDTTLANSAGTLELLRACRGAEMTNDVELIPYEHLWEIVVSRLSVSRKRKAKRKAKRQD